MVRNWNSLIEPSKMFACFLYHLYPLFHLKYLEILFSNLWLFPHVNDPILREALSKLVEYGSGVRVGRHVELHPSVEGVTIAAHHVAEVLADDEVLGHALHYWLNLIVRCGGVCCRILVLLELLMSHQYYLL